MAMMKTTVGSFILKEDRVLDTPTTLRRGGRLVNASE
jgi:hypothetical protein